MRCSRIAALSASTVIHFAAAARSPAVVRLRRQGASLAWLEGPWATRIPFCGSNRVGGCVDCVWLLIVMVFVAVHWSFSVEAIGSTCLTHETSPFRQRVHRRRLPGVDGKPCKPRRRPPRNHAPAIPWQLRLIALLRLVGFATPREDVCVFDRRRVFLPLRRHHIHALVFLAALLKHHF